MAEITVEEFTDRLRKVSKGQFLQKLHKIAVKNAAKLETNAVENASRVLTARTGHLAQSIQARVIPTGSGLDIELRAGGGDKNVKYAAVHEYGATIKPRKAKFLTIPVHDQLKTASGDARYPSARDVPGLTFAQSLKGQPLLVHQMTGEVWYLLRKKVEIPPRPYLKPAMDKMEKRLVPQVSKLLGGVLRG